MATTTKTDAERIVELEADVADLRNMVGQLARKVIDRGLYWDRWRENESGQTVGAWLQFSTAEVDRMEEAGVA